MFVNRQRLEEIEAQTLAPYALLSGNGRGRQYEDHEPAYRTAFQRDRDRILHSAAFRRLEYKTQVFVNDEGDYYRTRLTHTLEVTQLGRTLARALRVNEDLVETICLAHDLGHPPFGHAGEDVLNDLMRDHGGFEHNHQSYRVVTELENRYASWRGLNLTYETLAGIAKHDAKRDLSHLVGLQPQQCGSMEAQIADLVDAVAYNAHDLDDGLVAGLISAAQLPELELWEPLRERLSGQDSPLGIDIDDIDKVHVLDEVTRHGLIRELISLQVDDVLKTTSAKLAALQLATPEAVQTLTENVISHSAMMQQANRQFRVFLYEHMYHHYRVVRMATRAERFIAEIFSSLVAEPRQLPAVDRAKISELGVQRVVADYIAGMTDRSALLEYRRLYDPLMRP